MSGSSRPRDSPPSSCWRAWSTPRSVPWRAAGARGERIELAPRLALAGVLVGLIGGKSPLRTVWGLPIGPGLASSYWYCARRSSAPADGPGRPGSAGCPTTRSWRWYWNTRAEGASHDQVVFATAVGAIAYVLGFCSAWLVFRLQNAWWPLIANASMGLVHLSYATVDSIPPYLVTIFLGVLMVASLELHLRRSTWQAVGVPVQGASAAWTLAVPGQVGGLALVIAANLPSGDVNFELAARYSALTEPWKDFQRQVDRLVGGGKGQARPGSGLAFSDTLIPRGSFDLACCSSKIAARRAASTGAPPPTTCTTAVRSAR